MKRTSHELILESNWSGHVHASTILEIKPNTILAAWFQGTREKHDDVEIQGTIRQGNAWSKPFRLAKVAPLPHWNPVLRLDAKKTIHLYFKVGGIIDDWVTYVQESHDGAQSWTQPHELVKNDRTGGRGPVKNKCITLADGTVLAPASREKGQWTAFVDRSTDDGATWTAAPQMPGTGVIQPTLWEVKPGHVAALLRSNLGAIYRSDSFDAGLNWTPFQPTSLPNNNSGIDLVKTSQGSLVLVGNQASNNWGPRNTLLTWLSQDNGESWSPDITLAHDEQLKQPDGRSTEFSYPAVIQLHDGSIAVSYTVNRQNIAFDIIEL